MAGIILPTNILESSGIYTKTRELLLENFNIKGIVKLGKNTFMATKTSTIILFLEKIKNNKTEIIEYLEKSIKNKKDYSISDIEKPIKKYIDFTYKIDLDTFFNFFSNDDLTNKELNKIKIYKSYITNFSKQSEIKKLSEYITIKEMDKLCYFILTYKKKLVLYFVPSNNIKEEKKALGYKFSDRKGYEGIYIFNLGGKLYNPLNLYDDEKINHYILKNFNNGDLEIKKDIKNLFEVSLHELIDFSADNFEKIVNINDYIKNEKNTLDNAKKALLTLKREKVIEEATKILEKYKKSTNIENLPIKQVLLKNIETGGTPHTRTPEFWNNGTINWLNIGDMKDKYIDSTESKITQKGLEDKNLTIFNEGTVLFTIFASIGKVGILRIKTTLNQAICALIPNEKIVLREYLYYILLIEREKIAGKKSHRTQDNINQTKLGDYEIPVIKNIKMQKKFIKKIKKIEASIKEEI